VIDGPPLEKKLVNSRSGQAATFSTKVLENEGQIACCGDATRSEPL